MKNTNRFHKLNFSFRFFIFHFLFFIIASCSIQKKLGRSFEKDVLSAPALQTAHVGISILDAASGKYVFNYQGNKYFVPASNTKIATCYAAMKYLGDSLVGLRYVENDTVLFVNPTGDPTLLHRGFTYQPVFTFLKETSKRLAYVNTHWQSQVYGTGWTWNDFDQAYMVERNELPVYGNFIEFSLQKENGKTIIKGDIPFFKMALNEQVDSVTEKVIVTRRRMDNLYDIRPAETKFGTTQIPFLTYQNQRLLEDTLKRAWLNHVYPATNLTYKKIYSQPTDSLLKPMMHRSDNFFAEQSLLMVSNEVLGVMNDAKIIDTLLKTDFKDLPQKPRWVDGSGLSRYNLFTPQSFVTILNQMKTAFGIERIKEIFPTGGEGTLSTLYKTDSTFIYAKTGTLSGVVALSGFLYTENGRLLIFSVLVNNHLGSATPVRKAVETFIQRVRKEY